MDTTMGNNYFILTSRQAFRFDSRITDTPLSLPSRLVLNVKMRKRQKVAPRGVVSIYVSPNHENRRIAESDLTDLFYGSPNSVEPRCKICTRFGPPTASDLRTPESRYKSPVARRRELCVPERCHAKVGTDLKFELDSHSYIVDRLVRKIQELKRNVQDLDESKRHDRPEKVEQRHTLAQTADVKITDLKGAHDAIESCLREISKIKVFLEDENSWWKILKGRSVDCCQQKLPHLHGDLDGSPVTLVLFEEGTDVAPQRFVTSTPKKGNGTVGFSFRTSSRELTNEEKHTKQRTKPWEEPTELTEEYIDSYSVPYYNLDMRSALIEVASTDSRHDPAQRYAKTVTRSTVASEVWTEIQEDKSGEQKALDRSSKFKETPEKIQSERKEKKIDRSNVPSREIWYGPNTSTTYDETLRPRETFSSENMKYADFESNVDLNTEHPSKNTSSHKPRKKMVTEKSIFHKFPIKISKTRNRDTNI